MSNRVEYRITWQRQGQSRITRFYQTRKGVEACSERQRTASEEMDWLVPRLPEIVFGPVIEKREVGPWRGLGRE